MGKKTGVRKKTEENLEGNAGSRVKDLLRWMLYSALFALEICFLLFMIFHNQNSIREEICLFMKGAAISFAASFVTAVFMSFAARRYVKTAYAILLASVPVLLAAGVGVFFLNRVLTNAVVFGAVDSSYSNVDNGKHELYANKKIMVIVPHQDDEYLLLGGVLEEYTRYGSEVYVVFTTNGDRGRQEGRRIRESLSVLSECGIDEDHIVFLGYGDTWSPDGPPIYHAAPDERLTSFRGYTETYLPGDFKAYNEGNPYTRASYKNDMKDVILEYCPEIIYCIDYDSHEEHRTASLIFEENMADILREQQDYRPLVYKGFAYSTSLYAPFDMFENNIRSTVNTSGKPYNDESNIYMWDERVRLPVGADGLARFITDTAAYKMLKKYRSQPVVYYTPAVCNGDRVFWFRDTSSLIYGADISVSSGSPDGLNDFKLADTYDLSAPIRPLEGCGIWIPDADDAEKTVMITLPRPTDIDRIVLYDNPSEGDNVLSAAVTLDDGTEISVGALRLNGSGTKVLFEKRKVGSFTVRLVSTEGDKAGLSEIEAYCGRTEQGVRYIKLTDEADNFVYDYIMPEDGEALFGLYAAGCPDVLSEESYSAVCDSEKCSVEITGGKLRVLCPAGERCVVTVSSKDGKISDSAAFSNPRGRGLLRSALWYDSYYIKLVNSVNHWFSL